MKREEKNRQEETTFNVIVISFTENYSHGNIRGVF